jgi:anti-sigma-K factor RskA
VSGRHQFDQEHFEELRTQRALHGLDAAECAEFSRLLAERAGVDLEADELTVAAADLALAPNVHASLPSSLKQKLERDAKTYCASSGTSAREEAAPSAPIPQPALIRRLEPRAAAREPSFANRFGWIAAAAALVIALVGWWPRLSSSTRDVRAERDALAARGGVMKVAWSGTDNAKGAEGDVVFSLADQQGFMRIKGLAKNNPTREQYQLWIIDETQKQPIDGGVFDVNADGEVVIPIDPKLKVVKPAAFAVTVEKPGGVVVSAQDKVVLLGKAG